MTVISVPSTSVINGATVPLVLAMDTADLAPGPSGPAGVAGDPGATGATGLTGPAGPAGPAGSGSANAIKTFEDYGAVGGPLSAAISSLPDDTVFIQAAMTAERELRIIPNRRYRITSPLVWQKVPKLYGVGASSEIYADFSTPQMAALIFRNPGADTPFYKTGGVIECLSINAPCPAIAFDLTGGVEGTDYFNRWRISCNSLINRNTTGSIFHAVELINPTVSDGLFCTTFEQNFMFGGFKMPNLGDSVVFRDNTVTGYGQGFNLTAIQGATHCRIEANNITTKQEAIVIADYMRCTKILDNNIENSNDGMIAGQPIPGQLITFFGSSSAKSVLDPIFKGNSLNAQNKAVSIMTVGYCSGGVFDENNLSNTNTGVYFVPGIYAPTGFRIGRRNKYSNVLQSISSAGVTIITENGTN